MQPWAASFYKSRAWRDCRKGYAQSVGGLCERCLARGIYVPGRIVHHRVHLTPENISDASVSLSWDNLELLCDDCHNAEHQPRARRFRVDDEGRIRAVGP